MAVHHVAGLLVLLITDILIYVAVVIFCQGAVVHLAVELFLITGILIHAVMEELLYETEADLVALISFMIQILIYAVGEN